MKKLQQLLKQFLAREIGLEELQRRFSLLLAEDPGLASVAAAWLDAGEQDGRLSSALCTSLKNVLVSHLAASAIGVNPRDSGIFATLLEEDLTGSHAPPPGVTRAGSALETMVRAAQATVQRNNSPVPSQHDSQSDDAADDGVLKVGSIISRRFVLIARLGSGGMGSVFKARDMLREEANDRNPFVALKVLGESFRAHPDSMIALQREARRAQTLAHPNVITVHDFGRDGQHFYISMEHLEGSSLDELIRTAPPDGFPMSEAWPIIEGIGRALQYGHDKGIVHSDVKPGNIFVCSDGNVKVLDFGISRPMQLTNVPDSDQTLFDPGKRLGGLTPAYAALEMWAQGTPDRRDDIYALACVSYLLLTGRHPFNGNSAPTALEKEMMPERIESLSRSQWNALASGLALRRQDRTPTVSQFLEGLAPSSVVRARRRRVLMVAAMIASVGAALGVRFYAGTIEGRVLDDQGRMQGDIAGLPAERPVLTDEQQQEIESWLQLADLYLDDVSLQSSADDLAYVLSDGPGAVKQLYESVLNYDPWYDEALRLRSTVVNLYSNKAQQLVNARDFEGAMAMVRRGIEIDRSSRTLYRLQRTICDNDPGVCRAP
jgi:serine/threonine protein kinase